MNRKRTTKQRQYFVARGASCIVCIAHGWRAYREPEERDLMSPCTRPPIYAVWATNKREAVAIATARFTADQKGAHA